MDITPDTLHMDPEDLRRCLLRLASGAGGQLVTPRGNRVRAVIPVHLFGVCCAMEALCEAVIPYGLPIIEDAAQAVGAEYPASWRREARGNAWRRRTLQLLSDEESWRSGRWRHGGLPQPGARGNSCAFCEITGWSARYFHGIVGGNFRLDALQAAVLHAKLPFVEEWNAARRRNAALYRAALSDLSGLLELPAEPWKDTGATNHHTWHQYVVRAERREELHRHLEREQIGHAVYYPVPLHQQQCFSYLGHRPGDFPESERAASETIALPIFPELRSEEISAVAEAVRGFYLR